MRDLAKTTYMSSKSLLVLLSFGLLCLALNGQARKAINKRTSCVSGAALGLAKAMATGDKSCVKKTHSRAIKSFGLMHLLTPSGLHLSAFLGVFYFLPKTKLIACSLLFIGSFFTSGLYSLQRMLLFRLINWKMRSIKTSFLVTMIASILIGNYQASPISFSLSMLFWGSIVYHKGSKFELIYSLYICQCLVAIAFGQELNPLSIIVNPVLSALFALIFPLFLISYPFGELCLMFTRPFAFLLELMTPLMAINCSGALALLISAVFFRPSKKWSIVLLLFCAETPTLKWDRSYQKRVSPLPSRYELMHVRDRKARFLDRTCKIYVDGRLKCKKRPSKFGGPYL